MDSLIYFFKNLYSNNDFISRWETGNWTEFSAWLRIISDIVISASFIVIPVLFLYYSKKLRKDLPQRTFIYPIIFLVMFTGISHVLNALSFWLPLFKIITLIKFFTAISALLSVYFLNKVFPVLFDLKTKDELDRATRILKKQKMKLEKVNIDLEMFAYVASHDLQEPMRMVNQNIRRLEKRLGDDLDDRSKKYLNFAVDGSKRMIQMVTDLLEYSRHGADSKIREDVDLNEVFETACKDLQAKINNSNSKILKIDLPCIHGNKIQLVRLFTNLISNSIKYKSPDKDPKLEIKYVLKPDHFEISFEDNGRGFDQSKSELIFQMFKRLGGNDEIRGSGIGLATVKKIVDNHDGHIEAFSVLNQGSIFKISFPKEVEC